MGAAEAPSGFEAQLTLLLLLMLMLVHPTLQVQLLLLGCHWRRLTWLLWILRLTTGLVLLPLRLCLLALRSVLSCCLTLLIGIRHTRLWSHLAWLLSLCDLLIRRSRLAALIAVLRSLLLHS